MSAAITAIALTGTGTGVSAIASNRQGKAAQSNANYMAALSAQQGQLIQKQKEKEAELAQDAAAAQFREHAQQGVEIIAKQKAAMAAGGVSQQGSGGEIILDTQKKLAADEAMIRYNSALTAWSLNEEGTLANWAGQVQSTNLRHEGKQLKTAANINTFSTLLSGASKMAGSYSTIK